MDLLAASPTELRAEIRRLQKLLEAAPPTVPALRESAIGVLRCYLCPCSDVEGLVCACPGTCVQRAEKLVAALEQAGIGFGRKTCTADPS